MEKSTYLALGAIVLGAGYASSASSATIFINPSLTNASFETSNNPTATPPGWTPSGSPGAGAYTVTSAQYTAGADGLSGGRIVPDGTNAADAPSGLSGSGGLQVRCVMSDRAKQNRGADGPMTLGDMRQLGVQRLIAYCLNPPTLSSTPTGTPVAMSKLTA
jgi:hypothetical protein